MLQMTKHKTMNGRIVYRVLSHAEKCAKCETEIKIGSHVTRGMPGAGNSWAVVCITCRWFDLEWRNTDPIVAQVPILADDQGFDAWAIVEIMGHQRLAGRVTEQPLAGTNLLRVDVPAVGDMPAFTQLLGGAAIYRITPVVEQIARDAAVQIKADPVIVYGVRQQIAIDAEDYERLAPPREQFDPEEYDTDGPWPPEYEDEHDG